MQGGQVNLNVKNAPDLVTSVEYQTIDGVRVPIATTYTSKKLGLKECVQHIALPSIKANKQSKKLPQKNTIEEPLISVEPAFKEAFKED